MNNADLKLNKTYRIIFSQGVNVGKKLNDDPSGIVDTYIKAAGDMDDVEIVDIDTDEGVATFYWSAETTDELDMFCDDVPLASFKVLQVQQTMWVNV
jgi:hypothetical protein